MGAKYIFLKTGAYRPADLARAVKFSSIAKIDLLTVDGAGGGTGMSPWRMMNEWGIPCVNIWSLTYQYVDRLAKKGDYVPSIAFAGGVTMEDHIFKALALGATAVGIGRPVLYSLASYGQPGVERMCSLFKEELTMVMRLMGTPTIADITEDHVLYSDLMTHVPAQARDHLQLDTYESLRPATKI